MINYLISSVLFVVSGIIILLFINEVLSFFKIEVLKKVKNFKFIKKTDSLEKVDDFILKNDNVSAINVLKTTFHFDISSFDLESKDANFIENIHIHHMSALSRVVTLFDNADLRIDDLPIIEGLFVYRLELLRAYSETRQQQQLLRKKIQSEEGNKSNLSWAEEEFNKKNEDLVDKLQTNRRTLESKLESLYKIILSKASRNDEITYH